MRDYLAKSCQADQILNLAPGVQIEGCGEERVYLISGPVQLELSGKGVKDIYCGRGLLFPHLR